MLQSTLLRDDLILNDLLVPPTYPKRQSLVELNNKLDHVTPTQTKSPFFFFLTLYYWGMFYVGNKDERRTYSRVLTSDQSIIKRVRFTFKSKGSTHKF